VIGFVFGLLIGIWYLKTNHWTSNNVFGISFSIQAIEYISLGSFFNGLILLGLLFFYDIFWVFGTDVMVTVAKSFDGPIKLFFPQPSGDSPSMLGLGDIVIPGIFIALLLRFDAKNLKAKTNTSEQANSKDSTEHVYFWTVMFAYFLGLTTTVLVMNYFKAAQPALLYLVPACLFSSIGLSFQRNEFFLLFRYEEDKDKEKEKEKTKQKGGTGTVGGGEKEESEREDETENSNQNTEENQVREGRKRKKK